MGEALFAAILANQSSGPIQVHQFTFTPEQTNAQVAGFGTVLDERFTYDGKMYIIRSCFTHNNGIQIRFNRLSGQIAVGSNQAALDFIAEDFTVDTGIPGQSSFKSSLMDNINSGGQNAAQYRAFPGRFTGGTAYTITISK